MSRPRLVALLLALVTLVVYLPCTRCDFLSYDDDRYVTSNPVVQKGLSAEGIQWAFAGYHVGNWHPLTWLSHMLDCSLFGVNPAPHHFVNILFHVFNVVLLFVLILRMTGKMWPSAMVAALFAWHPLHVESVAWVSERKDVLSTFFALLSLLSYARYVLEAGPKTRRQTDGPSRKPMSSAYWLALLFFALGLLAKPMLVTLPFVLLLLDYWPLQRMSVSAPDKGKSRLAIVLEKWPFFALAGVSCAVTVLAQRSMSTVASLNQLSLAYRLENATVAYAKYLLKMIWPVDLAVLYPLAEISKTAFLLALLALVTISLVAWRWRHRQPCGIVGWLWFLGTLVPVVGLVQVGSAAMADRYAYLPSIGIFLAAVFLLEAWLPKNSPPKPVIVGVATVSLSACIWLTERQIGYWQDSETLFRHALAVTHNNKMAAVNLGVALSLQNQNEEALREYETALKPCGDFYADTMTQNNDMAHLNLAIALDRANRHAEAIHEYQEALRVNPSLNKIHFNLGSLYERMGRLADAVEEFRRCVQAEPQYAAFHVALARTLAELGNEAESRTEFNEAMRLDPHSAQPHIELAKIEFAQGRDTEAVNELRVAVATEPENFQVLATAAHYLAANENAAARDGQLALTLAQKADALAAHSQPVVLDILGMAYANSGDFSNATVCAKQAVDLANAAQLPAAGDMQKRWAQYNSGQPWRESFRSTNAPGKRDRFK